MNELLQRLSSLSGKEYGLLEVLVNSGFLSKEQLGAWVQQVVDDRLVLAETDPSRTQDYMRKLVF